MRQILTSKYSPRTARVDVVSGVSNVPGISEIVSSRNQRVIVHSGACYMVLEIRGLLFTIELVTMVTG